MNRIKISGLALALTALLALGIAASAIAYESHGCPYENACGWVNGSFTGGKQYWGGNAEYLAYWGNPECQEGNWSDCISSLTNNGKECNAYWHQGGAYQGNYYTNDRDTGTGTLTGGWNDSFKSLKWCSA